MSLGTRLGTVLGSRLGTKWPADEAAPAWYVSNSGDDGDDGLTDATPFATLAAVAAVVSVGETVYLAKGSTWREELTAWPNNITIRSYGAGDPPRIDGRNVASNAAFVALGGGTPNVYSIAWSHTIDASGGQVKHRVWVDGVMLSRVTSLALCNSTAGSFYSPSITTNGPDTINVHPPGSTDPTSDGKVYEITYRRWALQLYHSQANTTVIGIDTIGNAHKDGSLCVWGHAQDCRAYDGWIHNAFIIGRATDCLAYGMDTTEDYTMFVSYIGAAFTGSNGMDCIYTRCTADTGVAGAGLGTGFYAHTDGVFTLGTLQFEDCSALRVNAAYGGVQAATYLYKSCTYSDVKYGYLIGQAEIVILGGSGDLRGSNCQVVRITAGSVQLTAHGLKVYRVGTGEGPVYFSSAGGTASFERCTLTNHAASSTWNFLLAGNITWKRNVTRGTNQTCVRLGAAGAQVAGFDADFNNYSPTSGNPTFQSLFGGTVNYLNLPDWRAYLVGQAIGAGTEQSSAQNDPQLVNPGGGDFTIQNADVIALGAGAEQNDNNDPELIVYWNQHRVA